MLSSRARSCAVRSGVARVERLDVLQQVADPAEAGELVDAGEIDQLGRADEAVRAGGAQEKFDAHRFGQHAIHEVLGEPLVRAQPMEHRDTEQQERQVDG